MNNDDYQIQALLANSRTVRRAKYSDPELPKFVGNPSIEALPLINNRDQALDGIERLPKYENEMRHLPAQLRTQMAMDILHFFQPLPVHLKLEGMVSRMIRDGYLCRNPLDPDHSHDLRVRLKHFKNARVFGDQFTPTGCGFIICGMSGVGKTTGLIRVLNLYPQSIIHTNYKRKKFTRIVWLILECPKDGSTKGLCTKFFKTVDYVMGGTTNYSEKIGKESRSTNDLMESMANIAATHQIGVLVIDEIQYLNVAKSGGAEEMLNFFVNLVNTIGLPVVIVGTYDAVPLLTGTFRQARRGSGQGDLVWDKMPFDEKWRVFAESLWGYQYVQKNCPLTEELSKALHDVSYGIIDIANRVYLAAQIRAIEKGTEEITEGLLRSAYRDDFRLVSHILETLKTGGASLIPQIRDVFPPPVLHIERPVLHLEDATKTQFHTGVASDICDSQNGEQVGHGPARSFEPSSGMNHVNNTSGDNTCPSIMSSTVSSKSRKRKDNKKPIAITSFEDKDLRGIVARGQAALPAIDSYSAILASGYIKHSREFFPNAKEMEE